MDFSNLLKNLIEKAATEYKTVASNDPKIASLDDNTARGDLLDQVVEQQVSERKELWDKLHQLEKKYVEAGRNKVFDSKIEATPQRKALLNLMREDRDFVNQVTKEMEKATMIEFPDENVSQIQFKEYLNKQIKQYKHTVNLLKQDLERKRERLEMEKIYLKESRIVNKTLQLRQSNLCRSDVDTADRLREQLRMLQKKTEIDTIDLRDFLQMNYPPHTIDGSNPRDLCDISELVEQLMNQANLTPENPYIPLVQGTYWPPYIETLVKAGIAKYNSHNNKLICLENFSPTFD